MKTHREVLQNSNRAKAKRLLVVVLVAVAASVPAVPASILLWNLYVPGVSPNGLSSHFVQFTAHKAPLAETLQLQSGRTVLRGTTPTIDILLRSPGPFDRVTLSLNLEYQEADIVTTELADGTSSVLWANSGLWRGLDRTEEWNGLFLRRLLPENEQEELRLSHYADETHAGNLLLDQPNIEQEAEEGTIRDPRVLPYASVVSTDGSTLGEAIVDSVRPLSIDMLGSHSSLSLSTPEPNPVLSFLLQNAASNVPEVLVDGRSCQVMNEDEWLRSSADTKLHFSCEGIEPGVYDLEILTQKQASIQELQVSSGGISASLAEFDFAVTGSDMQCFPFVGDRLSVHLLPDSDGVEASLNGERIFLAQKQWNRIEVESGELHELCLPEGAKVEVANGLFAFHPEQYYLLPLRSLEDLNLEEEERPLAVLSRTELAELSFSRDKTIEVDINSETFEEEVILRLHGGEVSFSEIRAEWTNEGDDPVGVQDWIYHGERIWRIVTEQTNESNE